MSKCGEEVKSEIVLYGHHALGVAHLKIRKVGGFDIRSLCRVYVAAVNLAYEVEGWEGVFLFEIELGIKN